MRNDKARLRQLADIKHARKKQKLVQNLNTTFTVCPKTKMMPSSPDTHKTYSPLVAKQ
uniref:Uncharacterized protein n=1 Tax=Arion vulgaris TaxID=1028688 RepID=A0A0B6Z8J1_9EUPU